MDSFDKDSKIVTSSLKELLGIGVSLNSDAHPTIDKKGVFLQLGNKTECALLELAYKFGHNFIEIRQKIKVINTVPFSSSRKRMSVIFFHPDKKKYYIFSKGAPELLVENCKYYLNKVGNITEIT